MIGERQVLILNKHVSFSVAQYFQCRASTSTAISCAIRSRTHLVITVSKSDWVSGLLLNTGNTI